MTNNDANFYNATQLESGRYSHTNCTHPATAAHRHNCRYEMASRNFAASAARRKAQPKNIDRGPIVIRDMNEA